ncbi:unnamed protein product [Medioppia subpectinata]|uniref:Peptidase S1 domain-containing protein n=1 Tax=Medioppia subpectinata TaxID=1979941 RepID=A0A7R9KIL6_9ACAR|nr:unnamed protein product [Medioppia subpectinata]CAG2102846.1 unnamed protein product [Medioppia subpectinata]
MHLLNIILFIGLIISLSLCIVGCNESHARIQSYENITTTGCGCGRNARLGYNKCFKYMTEVHPWAVFITNFINGTWNGMSGVILNERWILTCAHGLYCGVNCTSNDIRVYLGLRNQRYTNHTYYTSGQYFIHPMYESYQWKPFDLGLIRVDTDIPLDGTFGLTGSNAICLPNKMAINKNTEYAQLVGHGIGNNTGLGLITIQKAHDNDAPGLNYVIKGRRIPYNLGSDICTSYSNITTAGCGVGRKWMVKDNTCFPFHPNTNTMFAGIQNGRVVQKGEQPWTVFIVFNSGSTEDGVKNGLLEDSPS